MTATGEVTLEELFDRLEHGAPPRARGFIVWVRRPSSRLLRIPLGVLLVLGGVFSFLPILGVWMLPLGLLILALDIPPLQKPTVRGALWIERQWHRWKAWRAARRQR